MKSIYIRPILNELQKLIEEAENGRRSVQIDIASWFAEYAFYTGRIRAIQQIKEFLSTDDIPVLLKIKQLIDDAEQHIEYGGITERCFYHGKINGLEQIKEFIQQL